MKYKRIHTIERYNEYCYAYEKLVMDGASKYAEEIDLLELLIEDFDNRTIATIGKSEDMSPVELLETLMGEHDISKAELARHLNVSRQLVTEIINYKRNISKKMVMKLSEHFKMRPAAFSREYELSGSITQKMANA